MTDIKDKTIIGIAWSFAQQFSVQIITLVVQIILARILLPEDFGLIAMIQIFVSVSKTLMDAGMTTSLIRDENASHNDYSSVFFLNLLVSIFLYVILYASANVISDFFEESILVSIIRVYALTFILQALVAVQLTKLTKELNFKLQLIIQLPSTIIGGLSGIVMAYLGFGVWSIVWMNIIAKSILVVQILAKSKWLPGLIFDMSLLKKHFNFGYKLTLSSLLTNIYLNSYKIIVGKLFSATQLGFYNQADTLRMFPVANITAVLNKVTFPMFSLIQNDNPRLKKVFRNITSTVFFIICPIMLFLALIAEELFIIVLTEKWLPAVPYFQILAISSFVYPLSIYNLNIILVKGRSDLHLKMEFIKKSISLSCLILIFPFGIWGVVYAQAISMFVHVFVNAYYCGKILDFSVKSQIKDLLPILFLSLFTISIVYFFQNYIMINYIFSPAYIILLTFSLFSLLYYSLAVYYNFKQLSEVKNFFYKLIKN